MAIIHRNLRVSTRINPKEDQYALLALCARAALPGTACDTGTSSGDGDGSDLLDAVVVFLGASITEAFSYPEEGRFFPDYAFHKVIEFGPDKSGVFQDVTDLEPDIVVFNECAVYFDEGGDTDMPAMRGFMEDIVDLCDDIGAIPVPATTLPIDAGVDGRT